MKSHSPAPCTRHWPEAWRAKNIATVPIFPVANVVANEWLTSGERVANELRAVRSARRQNPG